MSGWNNRIFRHKEDDGQELFAIHEAYYNNDGVVDSCTQDAISPYCDSPEELIEYLEELLNDAKRCKSDIIDYDSI